VRNAIETLESEVNERRQQLSLTLAQEPIWLQADLRRLEEVFVKLQRIAIHGRGGEIAISMHVQGGHALVRMQDTGIGIAPEALPHPQVDFGLQLCSCAAVQLSPPRRLVRSRASRRYQVNNSSS